MRCTLLALWSSLLTACEFPVSTSEYRVATSQADPAVISGLVGAYAADDVCADCVERNCAAPLAACATTAGCNEFVHCVRDVGNPAAEAVCAPAAVDLRLLRAHVDLRYCWASCLGDCAVGSDWSCVDSYSAPRPKRSRIVLNQTLSHPVVPGAVDATISICPPGDCTTPLDEATTDASGSYSAEVNIQTEPVSFAGFNGYRLFEGGGLYPSRLQLNLPIWTDRVERTSLLRNFIVDQILVGLKMEEDSRAPTLPILFVQIFDCQNSGADDIVFEVPSADGAAIRYLDSPDVENAALTATVRRAEGAAAISELPAGQHHIVVARTASENREVARGSMFVANGEVAYLNLYPQPEGSH